MRPVAANRAGWTTSLNLRFISPAFARNAGADYAGLGFDSVCPQGIADLHGAGVRVFVYTLNDPRDIELASSWGVDGIISDYPDRVPRAE